MSKLIYDENASVDKLLAGVDKVANTVKQTLGPKGRNIILQKKFGLPISCNDGVTIARDIILEDRLENAGAQFLIEASKTTNDQAGDGTTSVCVLAQTLIHEGFKAIKEGKVTATKLVEEMNGAIPELSKKIEELATPVESLETLENVATISCGGDAELGKLVASAIEKVGQYGVCTAEPGPGVDVNLTFVDGMAYDRGYIVPHFINDAEKMQAKYDRALVFVTARAITEQNDILPILQLASERELPLLLVCDNLAGQALQVVIANMARGAVKVVATKLPGFSTSVEPVSRDICALTGAEYFDAFKDVKEAHQGSFGLCKNLEVGSMYTKFLSYTEKDLAGEDANNSFLVNLVSQIKDQVNTRLAQAQEQLESYKGNNDEWGIQQTQERIARLGSGAALIQVGARTELEQQERLYRVEDAIQACRAAKEEGIVPGAGNIQIRLARSIVSKSAAAQVIQKALYSLYDQLRVNCESTETVPAAENAVIGEQISQGCNPETGGLLDAFKEGIIDPAKVTRCSLENAISVASIMLRTAGAVVEAPENGKEKTALQIAEEEHQFNLGGML